jgi:competence protein ComFC
MGMIDLFFPRVCLECGAEGRYICEKCIVKVIAAQPICPYCKHPSIDGATHVNCTRKLGIDGLTSVWDYEGVVRKAILALKYKYATEIGEELSDHFVNSLKKKVIPSVQCLIPIPIFWYRQNTRGFNQSHIIGRKVAEGIGWKFIPDFLVKSKSTISQVELSGERRRKNLRGVFAINRGFEVPGSVFLFDDVFTTGSTILEAAKVLKRRGVGKVWGLTMAR